MPKFVYIDDNGNKKKIGAPEPKVVERPTVKPEPIKEEIKPEEPVEKSPDTTISYQNDLYRKKSLFSRLFKHDKTPENEIHKDGKVYVVTQEGLEDLITELLVKTLSENFVTREEVQSLVEHYIQRMIISNNMKERNRYNKREGN